jgi:hypothetical protein
VCCSPALVLTCCCSFVLVSVLLLVPVCPHLFIRTWLSWLAWPPFVLAPISLLVPICPCLFIRTWLCWLGQPPFVLATARSCASLFFCPRSFVPARLHCLALVLIAARSCLSLFVCWSPPVCVRLVVLVPTTWWRLFGFRSCSLVFVWVHLCLFGFCSCSFGLCHARLCFDGVLLGSQACLYQTYMLVHK